MLKKRLMSMFLALTMVVGLGSQVFAINATPASQIYSAQISHAAGIDEYGSNIRERSEILSDVPISISQSSSNLTLDFQIADIPISIEATVRGKNTSGNMAYYDVTSMSNETMEVMTLAYIEGFSHSAIIAQEYCTDHPDARNVLELYLKVSTAEEREYYFVEIFDFVLDGFTQIDNPVCTPDAWVSKEFSPINSYVEEDASGISLLGAAPPASMKYTFVNKYNAIEDWTEGLEVEITDDVTDIPRGGNKQWGHKLEIVRKYTECAQAPEYNGPTSSISLTNVSYKGTAPINCAFQSMTIDGKAKKTGSALGLSASISVGYGPLSGSVSLGGTLSGLGSVDINDTFTGFVNSKDKMTKVLDTAFSKKYYLYDDPRMDKDDVGDFFQVVTVLVDYGNVSTSYNKVTSRWVMTATNTNTGEVFSPNYILSRTISVKVN